VVAETAGFRLDAPMSRVVVVPRDDVLLAYSGLDAGKASLNRVFTVDPRTGTSTTVGRLPQAVHDAAGTVLDGRTLLIGGGEQNKAYPDVVDVTAEPPSRIGRIDVGRSDNSAITVGDTAYVLGGFDETRIIAAVLASRDGIGWEPIADLPVPVRYGAVAADGPTIYVFGGRTDTEQITDIQAVDTTDGSVRRAGSLPVPLGHAGAVNLGGTIYVFGGRTGVGTSTAATTTSSTIYRFDPATGTVTEVGRLPKPVADFGVAVLGDTAYVLGGERGDAATDEIVTLRRR
jgi:non-specific serine/threonine protein kinase